MIYAMFECDVCHNTVKVFRTINAEFPHFWGYEYIGDKSYLMCAVCRRHLDEIA